MEIKKTIKIDMEKDPEAWLEEEVEDISEDTEGA